MTSISTSGAERMTPKAFLTGREIGTSTARAVIPRMVRGAWLIFLVSSLDIVPPHQTWCCPVGGRGFQQPPPGVLGGKCDALGLSGAEDKRIQPERLPAVIEPVQHSEVMAMKV